MNIPATGVMTALLAAAPVLAADAPRVVSTTPVSGDVAVDPALTELRVEFDVEMTAGSFSWVGGGPGFPKMNGSPEWVTDRICRLPVTLEPDHPYMVSINGGRFTGFSSRAGVPTPARPIVFATAPAVSGPPAWEQNKAAVARLRTAIAERYSHRDRLGLDWDELFVRDAESLADSRSSAAFAVRAWHLLAATEDTHVAVETKGVRLGLPMPAVVANFNGRSIGRFVPNAGMRSSAVAAGRTPDGIGYINIMTWEHSAADAIAAASAALEELADATALIIDVRLNSGGDEDLAQRFAGHFVSEPVVYAKHRFVDPELPGGFGPLVSRVLTPAKDGARFQGRVCVLMGPSNMSSCEAFLLMMRAAPNCTLVGARSLGSSGNPRSYELGNGVTVILPSWRATDSAGVPFEGVGIAPDVEVKTTPADFNGDDPVLSKALELLRE